MPESVKQNKSSCCNLTCFLIKLNGTLKGFFVFIAGLLTAGAVVSAVANSYYSPRGLKIPIQYESSTTNIHYYCIGSNSTFPTIWITSSQAHGVVDFYGLQYYLNQSNNRKVCTVDTAGFGWSDPLSKGVYSEKFNIAMWTELFKENGDTSVILGCWGGGAELCLLINDLNIVQVKSIVFIEAYPPNIEFDVKFANSSISTNDRNEEIKRTFSFRAASSKLILGLGIPWGLMPIFASIENVLKTYFPSERKAEYRVQLWQSKMWIGQSVALLDMIDKVGVRSTYLYKPLKADVFLGSIHCQLNDAAVCLPKNVWEGHECEANKLGNALTKLKRVEWLETLAKGYQGIPVVDDECTQEMPISRPDVTASNFLDILIKNKLG